MCRRRATRPPDWPKKIRTLTATELDRLTIDSAGRFYWDGKLVNYEPPQLAKAETDRMPVEAEPGDYRDDDHKTPEPIEGADLDRPVETQSQAIAHRDEHMHELDDVRATRTLHHS